MKRILTLAAVLLTLVACTEETAKIPQAVAHRGYWKAEGSAQNSLASLRLAGELGVYGSEFDVNMTSDGQLVVNHDFTYKELMIDETPFEVLRDTSLTLANGEIIPSLDEYLAVAEEFPQLKLIFELKSKGNPEYEAAAIPACIELIQKHNVADRVEFISFSLEACKEFARLMPDNMVEYLGGEIAPAELKEMGINGIDYHYSVFDEHPEWIEEAHKLGMICNAWTVNQEDDINRMLAFGADYITTNEPVLTQELIDKFVEAQQTKK